ncbi:facilitated trehalose transporter Tret1-like [Diorhabda carinulata]|uniref:facilitated trehalose transporter Tret1-like n=1 Tax=Diorhabda carinulata TaxID=1163345 RepID=UPI0025A21EDE|nr:facilitated trehalose transporter Tret1-like [Diorhabda carinulata]
MATLSLIFSVLGAWMVFLLLGFTKLSFFSKPGCDYTDQYCKFLIQAQSIPVGEIFGAFLFCFLAEIFGRKYIVLTLFIPIIVYSALIEFSYDSKNFIFASYARAISYGGALTILPVYLGEISEKQSRGKIISSVFALHIIGKYLQAVTKSIFTVAGISMVHYGSIVLSILTGIVFAVFTRDTPSFFIQRKQPQQAKESLRDIRNANVDIDNELEQLMGKRVSTENIEGTVMLCLESNGCLKAFIIMMSLLGFKILTGDYTLLLFIASPFNTTQHLSYVYILIGVTLCGSSILCSVLVDKIGRLNCLLISFVIMFVDQLVLIILVAVGTPINEFLVIILIIVFFFAYYIGIGPIPLVLVGELFPMKFKMILSATVTSFFFGLEFLAWICLYFKLEMNIMLIGSITFCLIATFTVKLFYFETKGKSLNEIQLRLNKK